MYINVWESAKVGTMTEKRIIIQELGEEGLLLPVTVKR